MADAEERDVGVFDFVLIAGSGCEFRGNVCSAGVETSAIEAAAAARIGEVAELRSGDRGGIALRTAGEGIGAVVTLERISAELARL